MKKIFSLLIISCIIYYSNAQVSKLLIQDTFTLRLFKDIAKGKYSGYSPLNAIHYGVYLDTCPTCFNGDTLNTSAFKSYTSDPFNIEGLGAQCSLGSFIQGSVYQYYSNSLNINNKGIFDMEPFRYFGWGSGITKQTFPLDLGFKYGFGGITRFYCDSNFISDISPVLDSFPTVPVVVDFYPTLSCKNNGITNPVILPNIGIGYGEVLDLSFNQIPEVSFAKGAPMDAEINLSHNNINTITNWFIAGKNVDLSYNNFNKIDSLKFNFNSTMLNQVNFSHNTSLIKVSIDVNSYFGSNYLPPLDFSYCSNLKRVYMYKSWNAIGGSGLNFSHCNIDTAMFDNVSADLSYNNISNINSWDSVSWYKKSGFAFLSDPNGFSLGFDLSHNKITNLPFDQRFNGNPYPNQFQPFYGQNLGYLDVSYNDIHNITGDCLSSLTELHIDHNDNLYCIPRLNNSLQKLYFDTSRITCLPNVGSFKINGTNSTIYPTCNTLNNVHHCKGYPTVVGRVYLDSNRNDIKDANENWLAGIEITLRTDSNGNVFKTFTDNNGYYNVSADVLGYFTIKAAQGSNYFSYYSVKPDSLTGEFSVWDSVYTQPNIAIQFPVTATPSATDMIVFSAKTWRSRPGFPFIVTTVAKNVGPQNLQPTITLQYDSSKIDFVSNNCSGNNAAGNTVVMSYNNFPSGFQLNCRTALKLKTTAQIGDTLVFYTTTVYKTSPTDTVTIVDTFYSVVTGSFDPNDKYATPYFTTTQVANGDYIDYTVHFQNTGNDTAFTVVIADTLSNLLQANSFQLMGSSHNCKTTINGNKVYFEFINIQLPDSNINQLGSNGFVRFRVKPVSNVTVGTIIPNTASIYFDYNKPVITNVANTKIVIQAVITPLTIISYQLRLTNDKSVSNEWQTANELNVSYYNIERSVNGKDFITIGKVKANNKSSNEYSFVDELKTNTQYPTTIYYRIVGVDYDVRKTYSSVKSIITNSKPNTVNIFPNPAKNVINIESKEAIKVIRVIDYLGKEVASFYAMTSNTNKLTINTHQFAKGLYVVQVTTLNTKVFNEKLLIE